MFKKWAFSSLEKQKGQILLIVVLVMVISLTVGLSVASKSITSLRTSTEEANSQKALSAAEAGIEQQIKNNVSLGTRFLATTKYTTSITPVLGTSFLLNGGNPVLQDDGIDLWLSTYSADSSSIYSPPYWSGNLTIYWGDSSNGCNNAALEIAIITGSKASPSIARYALDPCTTTGRASANHLNSSVGTAAVVEGKQFYYQTTITIASGLIAKIIPLYTNTHMAVTAAVGNPAIPSQGSIISSTGTSGSSQRKVNVFQGYPETPSEYFPYVLFSP